MKKSTKRTVFISGSMLIYAFVAMLVIGPSLVAASDSNSNGIDDEIDHRNSRSVEIIDSLSTDDELEIHSELEHADDYHENKDSIEFKIRNRTGNGLEVEVSYESNVTASSGFELEFGVEFESLINYTDTNLDGKYAEGDDSVDAEILLGPFIVNYTTTLVNGTLGVVVVASDTVLNLNVTIYVVMNYTIVNGTLLTPTELMIDISIDDLMTLGAGKGYALKLIMSTTSTVTSGSEFEYEAETEDESHHHSSGEDGIKTTNASSSISGAFTWNKTAEVEDTPKQVNMSLIDKGSENELYLSYGDGTKIFHDPKVVIEGIENTIPGPETPFPWEWIVIAVIVAVGAIVVVFLVKRTRKDQSYLATK